jgi:uncharacterized membrane protein
MVVASLFTPLLPGAAIGSDGQLVITASVFLNPLEVQALAPYEITTGTVFTAKAIIRNNGDLHLREVTAVIHLPKGLELAVSKAETTRGTIPTHKDATASWKVKALEQGNYIIMVLASGIYGGTVITEDDVVLVAVR